MNLLNFDKHLYRMKKINKSRQDVSRENVNFSDFYVR